MTGPAMVIVGAGECGTRAAFTLREEGWDGRIVLVGAEPSPPYERPPLSKTGEFRPLCDDQMLRAAGITLISGTAATGLDTAAREMELAGGRRVPYRRLLLATGARARTLPFGAAASGGTASGGTASGAAASGAAASGGTASGGTASGAAASGRAVSGGAAPGGAAFGGPRVHLLRTHADAVALRRRLLPGARVAVIGGGFIGLELASSAAALGCAVTVIELGPRLMGRAVPPRVAAVMAQRHVAAGVDVRCGTAVTGLAETASGPAITLSEGGAVAADVIVAGVGAVPETSLAQAAGIETADGVLVDSRFATSAPGVFAAGDCCRYPHPLYGGEPLRLESWRAAREHGAAAARAMLGTGLGDTAAYAGVPWFWSDQHDLTLQVAGLVSAAAREVVRPRPDGTEAWFGLSAEGRLMAAAAVGPGNAVAKDIKLAELLIARRAAPDPALLADPAVSLKAMLRSAEAHGTRL
jgi:3-phenylpropionate/trans-cinnamate dioxygenase ferredoxin reductase subunit